MDTITMIERPDLDLGTFRDGESESRRWTVGIILCSKAENKDGHEIGNKTNTKNKNKNKNKN